MKAAIVGNGIVCDYDKFYEEIKKFDFIICADGGINHLIKVNVSPNVLIGDFDSCDFDSLSGLEILSNTEFNTYNPEKNQTDMHICIDYALEKGFDNIVIFAALGGRVDHELSNIFNLKYILDNGVTGMIVSENNDIYITNSTITINRKQDCKISLIPVTAEVTGITLKGLYYTLENATIIQGTSLGISNEFISDEAQITVESGCLIVVVSKDENL